MIHIFLLIGVWVIAAVKGINFLNTRDTYIKSNETEKPQELIKTQKQFLRSLILAIVYTVCKIL